jgi:predicted esterase
MLGLLGLVALSVPAGLDGSRIEIVPQARAAVEAVASVPWVEAADRAWHAGKPLFDLASPKTRFSAKGWMAVTERDILIRVEARDARHRAPVDDAQLWTGDGIEVALDARGNATGSLPRQTTGVMGPDDAKMMFALAPGGPRGFCFDAEPEAKNGPLPRDVVDITRDEARGLTVYSLRLPWSLFDTAAGTSPTLGIGIQVNDRNPGSDEREILTFGGGVFGAIKTGEMARLAIGPPPGETAGLTVEKTLAWDSADGGRVAVALRSSRPHELLVELGGASVRKAIAPSEGLERLLVELMPSADAGPEVPFRVVLRPTAEPEREIQARGVIVKTQAVYDAVVRRLDSLLAGAGEPLLRRHFASLRALVTTEWALMGDHRENATRGKPAVVFSYLRTILAGLQEDGVADWAGYASGRRDLYCGYVSRQDRTFQFYVLTLPRGWDRARSYPLFVELHGAGNDNPLADVAARVGPPGGNLDLRGYESVQSYAQTDGGGYYVMPFGRGNLGYRGVGEMDVWEAYEDVHRLFTIDRDRRYLFGFSMGGGGTWSLGQRTPDQWAAVAVLAGGLWREKVEYGLARNLARTPVFVWCGENDSLFPNVEVFRRELTRYGGQPVVRSQPGLAHSFTPAIQKEAVEWLKTFRRERPSSFRYVSDDDWHRGAWGVTMVRDLRLSALPEFECTVEGSSVRIDSRGTDGLSVLLGTGGLGLDGDVSVVWNGREAYRGPATTIRLGTAEGRTAEDTELSARDIDSLLRRLR